MYLLRDLKGLIGPLLVPRQFPAMLRQSFGLMRTKKLRFRERRDESADIATFVFEPVRAIHWQAGQHLFYHLPHPDRDKNGAYRFFTISSAPGDGQVTVTTRLSKPGSSFKQALQKLSAGDIVRARGPLGIFTFDDPHKTAVFVAGGIGITPFRAILHDLDQRGLAIKVYLFYVNSSEDFPFRAELDSLEARHPDLRIRYVVSPTRVTTEDFQSLPDWERLEFYLSGSPGMVNHYHALLKNLGLPRRQRHRDILIGY